MISRNAPQHVQNIEQVFYFISTCPSLATSDKDTIVKFLNTTKM